MPLSMHPAHEILPMAQQVPLVRVDRPVIEAQVSGKTTAGMTQPETISTTRSQLLKMIMKNEQRRHGVEFT